MPKAKTLDRLELTRKKLAGNARLIDGQPLPILTGKAIQFVQIAASKLYVITALALSVKTALTLNTTKGERFFMFNKNNTNNGLTLKINDARISCNINDSTWGMRLAQFHRTDAPLLICTYSLPKLKYIKEIFKKRPYNIEVIAHEKFFRQILELADFFRYDDVKFFSHGKLHAKFSLSGTNTVWLGSGNFGISRWIEAEIGMHNKKAYDFFFEKFQAIKKQSLLIYGKVKSAYHD